MRGEGIDAARVLRLLGLLGVALAAAPLSLAIPGPIDATEGPLRTAVDLALPIGLVVLGVALVGVVLRLLLLEHADRVVAGLRGSSVGRAAGGDDVVLDMAVGASPDDDAAPQGRASERAGRRGAARDDTPWMPPGRRASRDP
jgi:hypothetical protein